MGPKIYPKFIAGKNLVAEIKIKMCEKFVPSFSICPILRVDVTKPHLALLIVKIDRRSGYHMKALSISYQLICNLLV